MPRSTWLALSLTIGASSASARPLTFDLAPKGTLTVETTQWTMEEDKDAVTMDTPKGLMLVGVGYAPESCTKMIASLVTIEGTTLIDRPSWAPSRWHAKASRAVTPAMTLFGLCLPFAGGGSVFAAVRFQGTSGSDDNSVSFVTKLLVAVEKGTFVASADAVSKASEDDDGDVPLSLPDAKLLIGVPLGFSLGGGWISKPGNIDKEAVRIAIYPTTIGCQQGLSARPDETMVAVPDGVPKAFYNRAATKTDKSVRYAMCSDVTGGVMIADVTTSKPGPLPADLAGILASASTAAHAAGRTPPEQLKISFADLGNASMDLPADAGGWRVFPMPMLFALEQMWPRDAHAMVSGTIDDKCGYTGSDPMMPSPWRTATNDKGVLFGCVSGSDGRARKVMFKADHAMSPDDRRRITSVIHALATAMYPATAPLTVAAPTSSTPTSSTPTTTAPAPEVATAETTPYVAPYVPPSRDDSDSRPLRTYLYGASIAGHLFASDGHDDSYGVSLGYTRALAARLRLALEAGYNQDSGVLVDGRLELGSSMGDDENSVGLWGVLGVDGLGLGEDEMTTAPRIDADLYYGLRTQLVLSSIDLGLGYVWRNADTVDHSFRFDLGYRLESGHHLGFRYTGYGDAGHFLSLAYRY